MISFVFPYIISLLQIPKNEISGVDEKKNRDFFVTVLVKLKGISDFYFNYDSKNRMYFVHKNSSKTIYNLS